VDSKLEKYYNYIVDELVSETIFDQYDEDGNTYSTKGYFDGNLDGLYIKVPYYTQEWDVDEDYGFDGWFRVNPDIGIPEPLKYIPEGFPGYVSEKYGARPDDFFKIFTIYRNKMLSILGISAE
jgi:hypothetical protein